MTTLNWRSKSRIDVVKCEAISKAESLGHKLKTFKKYRDSEIYYSSFCARCSAYLRITASDYSGGAVEDRCQRFCDCKRPLTADDLDGKCIVCRGSRLTLYPKTSAIRADDAHFNEYCRKKDRDYEPSPETLSDYFWCCQGCHKQLGPGHQGDPDQRGFCSVCITSERFYTRRKAEAIQRAGGIRAWQRKRLLNKFLLPVDYTAIVISFLAFTCILLSAVSGALYSIWKGLRDMWSHADDRVLICIVAAAAAWCALRWKRINSKPSEF